MKPAFVFRALVIASALGLCGILVSAVLVDYQVISRMYFDLLLVITLCISMASIFLGSVVSDI
jgi:cytochrome c biogenesis protein CcdA